MKASMANDEYATGSHAVTLRLRRLGIDTHQEAVVYMRQDCHICRSEGFSAQARIQVRVGSLSIIATLEKVTTDLLMPGEASLSDVAWHRLSAREGDEIAVMHSPPVDSLRHVRGKIYGRRLEPHALRQIVGDIVGGRYSDVHLAAFIAACAGRALNQDEILGLTQAMVATGSRLEWGKSPIADKHCVGGLPGNRTTPIVVAIVAACGLTIPKTSSRAITSPAGTADTMETLAPVELDVRAMRHVVEQEGGCIVWGGAVDLSPADDILIRVERALDLDSEGQMVASVLSKKIAAGATHLVLDLPVGPTAKVRTDVEADALSDALTAIATAAGISVRILKTDGSQPVGRGIGPALEARDVVRVLRNEPDAPESLRRRAIVLAGTLLELTGKTHPGEGAALASQTISDGRAWRKFVAICQAQGGLREPPRAPFAHEIVSPRSGRITAIDNRILARIAKLAGAPAAKAAGIELHAPLGASVSRGQPLYTLHAEARGELAYALDYIRSHPGVIELDAEK
jgi:thymidine phosphorylase